MAGLRKGARGLEREQRGLLRFNRPRNFFSAEPTPSAPWFTCQRNSNMASISRRYSYLKFIRIQIFIPYINNHFLGTDVLGSPLWIFPPHYYKTAKLWEIRCVQLYTLLFVKRPFFNSNYSWIQPLHFFCHVLRDTMVVRISIRVFFLLQIYLNLVHLRYEVVYVYIVDCYFN